jgi:hypothetical protein
MDWRMYPNRPVLGKGTKHRDLLYQPLTFCGVTNYVGAWLKRVNMSRNTFIARVTRQGLTPLEALTRPDSHGNCLRSLTPEELETERRRLLKARTGYCWGGAIPGYRPTIGVGTATIALGTFDSADEAASALNTAMAQLPGDWRPEDRYRLNQPLTDDAFQRIEGAVRHKLAEHFPERFDLDSAAAPC